MVAGENLPGLAYSRHPTLANSLLSADAYCGHRGVVLALGLVVAPPWTGSVYLQRCPFPMAHLPGRSKRFAIAPLMLVLRAGALGFGLVTGFLFPPRAQPRVYTGLTISERLLKRSLDILGA